MTALEAVPVRAGEGAAWVCRDAVRELRNEYFAVAAALDQVTTVTAGTRHPLPARSRRCWADALALADRAEQAINAGRRQLRQVPGMAPLDSLGDIVIALTAAESRANSAAQRVGRLGERIECARRHLIACDPWSPEAERAAKQWRLAAVHLGAMRSRLEVGAAGLRTYAEGVSGGDPRPARQARLARLLPHTRGPAGEILAGAVAAGRLVVTGSAHPHGPVLPAARPGLPCGRLLAAVGRRARRTCGARPGGAAGATHARVLSALLAGDLRRYERRLHHPVGRGPGSPQDAGGNAAGYAGYLAAAFLLAVERRFRPGQDRASIARCVATALERYDPVALELDPSAAEWLIRTALGEPVRRHDDAEPVRRRDDAEPVRRDDDAEPARCHDAAGPARLVTIQTVLLVSLLVDENPGRRDLDELLAEAGRVLAGGDGPTRLATGTTPPEDAAGT